MSTNCNGTCSSCSENCSERKIYKEKQNEKSNIRKVIGVVSGKGGVGKSFITSILAASSAKKGYKTAILDADITGPSIPKLFGIKEKAFSPDGKLINPAISDKGVKIMSVNLLLENDTDPVIWRGPVIAGTVKQFWTEVSWGDVDYMFVDMPPGTGDVPLTVFQSLPIDGIVIVTSPQDLVSMIVEKAVNMAKLMNIPILGIVENMSYMICPHCGEKLNVFGESKLEIITQRFEIENQARVPINHKISEFSDQGKIEELDLKEIEIFFDKIIKSV